MASTTETASEVGEAEMEGGRAEDTGMGRESETAEMVIWRCSVGRRIGGPLLLQAELSAGNAWAAVSPADRPSLHFRVAGPAATKRSECSRPEYTTYEDHAV